MFLLFLRLWLINRHCLYLISLVWLIATHLIFWVTTKLLSKPAKFATILYLEKYVCMHVYNVCACSCVWLWVHMCHGTHVQVRRQPKIWSLSSTMFQIRSLVVCHLWGQGRWSSHSWGFFCLCLPTDCRSSGGADAGYYLWLCVGSGDTNSGPHFLVASASYTELFL